MYQHVHCGFPPPSLAPEQIESGENSEFLAVGVASSSGNPHVPTYTVSTS
ncbi:MAG: hypothetical protein R3B45_01865 [Bdellovibrionota bacterium]